jgi:hypothetical protein
VVVRGCVACCEAESLVVTASVALGWNEPVRVATSAVVVVSDVERGRVAVCVAVSVGLLATASVVVRGWEAGLASDSEVVTESVVVGCCPGRKTASTTAMPVMLVVTEAVIVTVSAPELLLLTP